MSGVGIYGYGRYDASGISGTRRTSDIELMGIDDLKWKHVSDVTYKRFGQLDALSKAAMAATEMIGISELMGADIASETGITLGTKDGCLGTDIDFRANAIERDVSNPRLFAYTLPSTVCGDLAIRHGFQGANACYMSENDNGVLALAEGFYLVESGELQGCLCLEVDALFEESASAANEFKMNLDTDRFSAYAFLLMNTDVAAGSPLGEFAFTPGEDCKMGSLRELCGLIESRGKDVPITKIGYDDLAVSIRGMER